MSPNQEPEQKPLQAAPKGRLGKTRGATAENTAPAAEENPLFSAHLKAPGLLTEETSSQQAPSLKQFIQQRLKEQAAAEKQGVFKLDPFERELTRPASVAEQKARETYAPWVKTVSGELPAAFLKQEGTTLNLVDTQDIAGIEGYLPTPWVRLRLVQQRLESEITQLEQRIHQQQGSQAKPTVFTATSAEEAMPNPRVSQLQHRLQQLQQRHHSISTELTHLLQNQSALVRLGVWLESTFHATEKEPGSSSASLSILEKCLRKLKQQPLQQQLGSMQTLLQRSEALQNPSQNKQVGADEWATVFYEMDKTVKAMEQQNKMAASKGVLNSLNNALQGLYNKAFGLPQQQERVQREALVEQSATLGTNPTGSDKRLA